MSSRTPEDLTVAPDGRGMDVQPRWRADFPVDWAQDEYVSRRDLVKFLVLTSLAFVVGQFWLVVRSLRKDRSQVWPELAVAPVGEVPVGGAKLFHYPEGSSPRLLIRTADRSFVAYDQQCTHLLCPVIPKVPEGILHCPCHHGIFDLATGRAMAGPPRRPLPKVLLEIRGDTVFATGIEERTS